MNKIMMCGGDLRQIVAANILSDYGFEVCFYKNMATPLLSDRVEVLSDADFESCKTVVLPLPCSKDDVHLNCDFSDKPYLEDIFSHFSAKHRVYGGRLTPYIKGLADRMGVDAVDILENEGFSIKNAYLTAEAAIKIAISESRAGLLGMKVLVVGYGRIGKCLAYLLKNMGAYVNVSARKESDLAWIECFGYNAVETKTVAQRAGEFDIIFNTVPVNLFKPSQLSEKTVYIELASKPYGISFDEAEKAGKNVVLAPSLPGKVSPVAAGKIIAQTVIKLEKEGRN